jgi:hypothetical protein
MYKVVEHQTVAELMGRNVLEIHHTIIGSGIALVLVSF